MPVLKFKNPETKEWQELAVCSDGVTFIPSIDKDGNLSWANNGHLVNPDTINIFGKSFSEYATKDDFPKTGQANLLYIDLSTNKMYRWDDETKAYTTIGGEGGGSDFGIQIVDELPAKGDLKTIYYVPDPKGKEQNMYNEYMWVDDGWERLGITALDADKYYTKDEVDEKIKKSLEDYEPILKHTITVGEQSFNGTEDVVIPIYEGDINIL